MRLIRWRRRFRLCILGDEPGQRNRLMPLSFVGRAPGPPATPSSAPSGIVDGPKKPARGPAAALGSRPTSICPALGKLSGIANTPPEV